jgi:peptidoglycan/xylan/chitin deacetylase (PgdA/CDA1 family)
VRVQVPPPAPDMFHGHNNTQSLCPLLLTIGLLLLTIVLSNSPQQFKLPWFKLSTANHKVDYILPPKAPRKVRVPILVYHYVEIVTDKNDFLRARLAVSPQNFENQLISLKKSGYTFYFIKDISTLLNGSAAKPVIITFDDGYGDFYTDALPILKRQNVKATAFINSGLIGKLNYMTREQVLDVVESGLVEIGGHSFSHQNLVTVGTPAAKKAVVDDVKMIKEAYGITPVSFAYPYGAYNNGVKELVREAGYRYAATLDKGWVVQEDSLLVLPRVRPEAVSSVDLGRFLDSL